MTVTLYGNQLIEDLSARAAEMPRKRLHFNLHRTYSDNCQRLFNAIGVDSYIPPHRHSIDPKTETLIAVHGLMTLVLFDSVGIITDAIRFGTGEHGKCVHFGVEIPPGIWHTIIAEVPDSVLFEVKAGPFDPGLAKEIAPWAPVNGSDAAGAYLQTIRATSAEILD